MKFAAASRHSRQRGMFLLFSSVQPQNRMRKVQGFSVGAIDYVTKPYQRNELLARVHTHLELNRLRHHLEDLVDERTTELRESERKLRTSLIDSITALASTVEMRDPYTAGHQRRVAQLAIAIGKELHLSKEQIEGIQLAGVVHDVGKIQNSRPRFSANPVGSPLLNLNSSNSIPKADMKFSNRSTFPGRLPRSCCNIMNGLNGSGYPQALKGEQILLEAKIIAVADVVESMTSHRPYRPGLGIDAALHEIELNKGELYEPEAVEACIRLFRELSFALAT